MMKFQNIFRCVFATCVVARCIILVAMLGLNTLVASAASVNDDPVKDVSVNDDPAAVISERIDLLLGEFSESREQLENDNQSVYQLVDRIAGPLFDFHYISKLVLARHWKSASETQRRDFALEFKRLLIVTYATALFKYTGDESIIFKQTKIKEKQGKRFATVNSEVKINDAPISVVYALIDDGDGSWKIYNLIIGDLNMVLNYRNVMQSTVNSAGLDDTIADMKTNNERNFQ